MRLTARETTIIQAVVNPDSGSLKEIAFRLGICYGYLKWRINGIYEKLEWPTDRRDIRRLTLWAVERNGLRDGEEFQAYNSECKEKEDAEDKMPEQRPGESPAGHPAQTS